MTCPEHPYIIDQNEYGERLICRDCGKFYGYIKDERSLKYIQQKILEFGCFYERFFRDASGRDPYR